MTVRCYTDFNDKSFTVNPSMHGVTVRSKEMSAL